MKNFLKILLIIVVILVIVIGISLLSVSDESKTLYIEFEEDKIPTLVCALKEEKKVSGVSVGIQDGVKYKEITYQSGEVSDEEIDSYKEVLMKEDGFLIIMNGTNGIQLSKQAFEINKKVVVTIRKEQNSVIIKYEKRE